MNRVKTTAKASTVKKAVARTPVVTKGLEKPIVKKVETKKVTKANTRLARV